MDAPEIHAGLLLLFLRSLAKIADLLQRRI
jgi:hypothetical protein